MSAKECQDITLSSAAACKLASHTLTHLSLGSFLWDIYKQYRPRSDVAECGVGSGSPIFANRVYYYNLNKNEKYDLTTLKLEMNLSN